jgi:hypothetical protein
MDLIDWPIAKKKGLKTFIHSQDRSFKKIALSQDRIAFPFEPPMKAKKTSRTWCQCFFLWQFSHSDDKLSKPQNCIIG